MSNERFREKIVDLKIVQKKKPTSLNESAQVGDKVVYDGKKGYVIGQSLNGDLLVQIQGSVDFAKPDKVKVVGMKAKTMELPYKFDEKTQKVLFEQFVKCGIYMGRTPVKTSNCFIKYSQWRDADLNENVNVFSDGELTQMPKGNVVVFEDPNQFADPTQFDEGTILDQTSGQVIENILLNVIDYSNNDGMGDAKPVRVIRKPGTPEAYNDVLPKGSLGYILK